MIVFMNCSFQIDLFSRLKQSIHIQIIMQPRVTFISSPTSQPRYVKGQEEFGSKRQNYQIQQAQSTNQINSIHKLPSKKSPGKTETEINLPPNKVITNASRKEIVQNTYHNQNRSETEQSKASSVGQEYASKITQLEKEKGVLVSKYESQRRTLIESNGQMRKTIEKLYDELNNLRRKVHQPSIKHIDDNKVDIFNTIIQNNENKITELQNIVIQKNKAIEKLIEEKKVLLEKNLKIQMEYNTLEASVAESSLTGVTNPPYVKVIESMAESNSGIQEKLQQFISEKGDIEQAYKELSQVYQQTLNQNQRLKLECYNLSTENEKVKHGYRLLQSKADQEYATIKTAYETLEQSNKKSMIKIGQLAKSFVNEFNRLNNDLADLHTANKQLLNNINTANQDKVAQQKLLTSQIQSLQFKLSNQHKQLNQVKSQLSTIDQKYKSLSNTHSKLQQNLRLLEEAVIASKCDHLTVSKAIIETSSEDYQQILVDLYDCL